MRDVAQEDAVKMEEDVVVVVPYSKVVKRGSSAVAINQARKILCI